MFRGFVLLVLPVCLVFGFALNASAALTGNFVGSGTDAVSPGTISPDGQPDFNINISGLRSIPTQIRILSDSNGVWVTPFNGGNWLIGLPNYSNGAGDLYFSQYPSNNFTLVVGYADGTSDQTTVSMPPPPISTLAASLIGVGYDRVSEVTLSPDGRPDYNIRLTGLRSAPAQIQVSSDTGGVWSINTAQHWQAGLASVTRICRRFFRTSTILVPEICFSCKSTEMSLS